MNTHDKIDLPEEFRSGNDIAVMQATIKRERMQEILRDAIEADRKRRGEPVAWQFYDDGRWWNGDDRIKDHRKNTESAGYKTRDLYTAPQPNEPVKPAVNLIAAEAAILMLNKLGYLWSERGWVLVDPVKVPWGYRV